MVGAGSRRRSGFVTECTLSGSGLWSVGTGRRSHQGTRKRPAAVAERPLGPPLARPVLRASRPQRAGGGRVFRVPCARSEVDAGNRETLLGSLLHAAVF